MKKVALMFASLLPLLFVFTIASSAQVFERSQAGQGTFRLNMQVLRRIVNKAPMEFTAEAARTEVILELPMPDGTMQRFRIEESPIMEPELAARFPDIRTYSGQGIDDRSATLRFDLSPRGFHGQILSTRGTVYIEPSGSDRRQYATFFKHDRDRERGAFECLIDTEPGRGRGLEITQAPLTVPPHGTMLRNYRLALAATGEYTVAAGGTVPLAMARMTTTMNRINGIFERELAVRMTFVANNSLLIYTDGATDPYTNTDGFAMMAENQANVDMVIGPANYDVGHVFSTGGGGIARLTSPCLEGFKAQGVTGLPNPVGDPFDVDYVAHEMGHQFGGTHTFNTTTASCGGGNRDSTSAYEPGGGSTMVAYAGICAPWDLQRNSNDYFHIKTLEQAVTFITAGGNCAAQTATGNTPPTVSAGTSFTIPRNTAFSLTATSGDANGDAVTHAWEQYDLGPEAPPEGDGDGMARPIFRSYSPTVSATRHFPSLPFILNNANVPPATYNCGPGPLCITGESLPNITRTMNFQVTARDNRSGGGGIVSATTQVNVTADAGPFVVTQPNAPAVWSASTQQTVLWDVAGTTAAPVSCSTVNIRLSTDGGMTFPLVLAAGTPNDGSQIVTVPNVKTTTARIKVEAAGNVFFDISGADITINSRPPFDFDGDGRSDLSVFRPSEGVWYIDGSTAGFTARQWGTTGDRLAPADFDADGKSDIAVWRSSGADPDRSYFHILNSSNGTFRTEQFGRQGDEPIVVGDWDGDGISDLAVYRDSAAGSQNNFYYRPSSVPGSDFTTIPWGITGDKPMHGDFDGDGKLDAAVFRPADATWYIRQSSDTAPRYVSWGLATDRFVPADYDGDGRTDPAVFRDGVWYILLSGNGLPRFQRWGSAGDSLVPADYDGDGKADIAIFRGGTWWILRSESGSPLAALWGVTTDSPVPAAYRLQD